MGYDFSLKRAVVEVDRDADRRWSFATDKMKLAEDKGETFSDSAPLEEQKNLSGMPPEGRGWRFQSLFRSNHFSREVPFHVCFDTECNSM